MSSSSAYARLLARTAARATSTKLYSPTTAGSFIRPITEQGLPFVVPAVVTLAWFTYAALDEDIQRSIGVYYDPDTIVNKVEAEAEARKEAKENAKMVAVNSSEKAEGVVNVDDDGDEDDEASPAPAPDTEEEDEEEEEEDLTTAIANKASAAAASAKESMDETIEQGEDLTTTIANKASAAAASAKESMDETIEQVTPDGGDDDDDDDEEESLATTIANKASAAAASIKESVEDTIEQVTSSSGDDDDDEEPVIGIPSAEPHPVDDDNVVFAPYRSGRTVTKVDSYKHEDDEDGPKKIKLPKKKFNEMTKEEQWEYFNEKAITPGEDDDDDDDEDEDEDDDDDDDNDDDDDE